MTLQKKLCKENAKKKFEVPENVGILSTKPEITAKAFTQEPQKDKLLFSTTQVETAKVVEIIFQPVLRREFDSKVPDVERGVIETPTTKSIDVPLKVNLGNVLEKSEGRAPILKIIVPDPAVATESKLDQDQQTISHVVSVPVVVEESNQKYQEIYDKSRRQSEDVVILQSQTTDWVSKQSPAETTPKSNESSPVEQILDQRPNLKLDITNIPDAEESNKIIVLGAITKDEFTSPSPKTSHSQAEEGSEEGLGLPLGVVEGHVNILKKSAIFSLRPFLRVQESKEVADVKLTKVAPRTKNTEPEEEIITRGSSEPAPHANIQQSTKVLSIISELPLNILLDNKQTKAEVKTDTEEELIIPGKAIVVPIEVLDLIEELMLDAEFSLEADEPEVVGVKDKDRIVLGIPRKHYKDDQDGERVDITPVLTFAQLKSTFDYIDNLEADQKQPILKAEIVISEEMLEFIDEIRKIIPPEQEQEEDVQARLGIQTIVFSTEDDKKQLTINRQEYLKIRKFLMEYHLNTKIILSSGNRELQIDIAKLKYLMKLNRKKKRFHKNIFFKPNEQAPEEITASNISVHGYNNAAIPSSYQLNLMFILVNNKISQYKHQFCHHILMRTILLLKGGVCRNRLILHNYLSQ